MHPSLVPGIICGVLASLGAVERNEPREVNVNREITVAPDGAGGRTTTTETQVTRAQEPTRSSERSTTVTTANDGQGQRSWTRESETERSDGSTRTVRADGSSQREGDRGSWEAEREGTATDAKGRQRSWTAEVDGSWQANDRGGRDTERRTVRNDDQGNSVSEEAQRRSIEQGNQRAWVEQAVRTLADGETVSRWQEGRTNRHKLKDGYAEERISRGEGDRGGSWHRHEQVRVAYRDDGSKSVRRIEAIKREGKPTYFIETVGVWTRSSDGRSWSYVGEQVRRENRRVIETKTITETRRRLPIPERIEDVIEEGV